MNKDKLEKFNDSLEKGVFVTGCNDPEILALLKAGEKIKDSAFNNSAPDDNFKDRLKRGIAAKRQADSLTMKNKINRFFENFNSQINRKRLYPVMASLLIVAVVMLTFKFWPNNSFSPLTIEAAYAHDNFTVEPTAGGELGVENDTQFIIKSKTPIASTDSLRDNITLFPTTNFELKKVSDYEFNLIPENKLSDKTVYRLQIASTYINDNGLTVDYDYSWAFQVKDVFKVIGSIPTDRSKAPANTGIEISFSNDNFTDFEDAFNISPKVSGRFEKHNRTMVFVPEKPLTAGVLYTVTVDKKVKNSISGENLSEDFRFQFEVQDTTSKTIISFVEDSAEFSSTQNPAFGIYVNQDQTDQKITTKVYNFHKLDDYTEALKKYYEIPYWSDTRFNFKPDYSKLSLAATYDLSAVESDGRRFLVLPSNLPVGYYIIEAKVGDSYAKTFVQISDISAYASVTTDKTIFWINSVADKKLSDIKVTNLNSKETVTAKDNVAIFNNSEKGTESEIFVVSAAGENLVVGLRSDNFWHNESTNDEYWNYIYTDRSLYQPSDEINFWGLTRARSNDSSTFSKEVEVSLFSYDFLGFYQEPVAIAKQKVETDGQGFFIGKLTINNLTPKNYYLKVTMDGRDVSADHYISVTDYIKPAYMISAEPESKAVLAGDKIKYQIKSTFFEGTPLPNNPLVVNYENTSKEVKTDSQGVAKMEYTANCSCSENWCPASCEKYLSVNPKLSEAGEIVGYGRVAVFRSLVEFSAVKINQIPGKNQVRIEAGLYNVDLNNEANNWQGSAASGHQIEAQITQIEYIAYQIGTYYDFINKTSYPTYRYEAKRTPQGGKIFTTNNDGQGVLEFDIDPKYSYEIKLGAADKNKNFVYSNLYFSSLEGRNNPGYRYYYLTPEVFSESGYGLGENINLKIVGDSGDLKESGKFLFLELQNGLKNYQIKDLPKTSFTLSEANLPNVHMVAVWFDGSAYYPISPFNVYFKKENHKLDISVTSDKEKYRPGEEATLNIVVKDNNNRGVKTKINISAVDIAMDPLGGIPLSDPLEYLYRRVSSGLLLTKYSHKNQMLSAGAEGGGGGDGGRSYFPDLALFTQVDTNSSGEATVKFKLPDTVTTWQINTQAISNNLKAGGVTTKLKVSLPFFAVANFSKQYLAGDEPIVKAAVYGDALKNNDQVNLKLESDGLGISGDTKNTLAFSPAYFNLGQIKQGNFDFRISSLYQNNSDAISHKISVTDSLLSERTQTSTEIKDGQKIIGSDNLTTKITLMDNNRGRYYHELLNLSYSDGVRVDQKASRVIAGNLIKDYFESDDNQSAADLKIYQTTSGGISLLPYSSEDLQLSVLMSLISSESFDKNLLANYFYGIYNNTNSNQEEISLALSGLAALNEPVLIQLRSFSKIEKLTPTEKLYLALGAQEIGDATLAKNIYQDLISQFGEELDPYLRLKIDDKNNDANSQATALAAIIATSLDDNRAEKLWQYAIKNQPQESLTNLERLLYLKKTLPNVPAGDAKFSLTINEQEFTKDLKRGEKYSFYVSPEQLKDLNIIVLSGNILAISDYEIPADLNNQSKLVAISKAYFSDNKKAVEFKEGDVIEVRIKPEIRDSAIDGLYEVTDILPSGLKLITNVYSRNLSSSCNVWYPYEVSGQKVKFIIDKNWNKSGGCQREEIRYFARVSQPGKYIVEPVMIQSVESVDLKSFSGGGQINIKY